MKKNSMLTMKRTVRVAVVMMMCALSSAVMAQGTIISGISPWVAEQGATVTLTIDLDGTSRRPPVPPSQVKPTHIKIGTLEGSAITRTGFQLTAGFTIPDAEPTGLKTVLVTFPGPRGEVTFSADNAFEVIPKTAPPDDGTGDTTPPPTDETTGVKNVFEGYNLFAGLVSTTVNLMDNDGSIVHSWVTGYRPGNSVYLLGNGELLHTGKIHTTVFDNTCAGGVVQTIDWEGNITWEYTYGDTTHLQHHDVEMLPNGNVLLIAWQYKTREEAIAAGRNPSLLQEGALWPDSVIEVRPLGPDSGQIVWEWHIWDHLVQEHDATKANYGSVAAHPELIDLNHAMNGRADWNHINAIDYNADLDQILLSVHSFNEIWIIDHSTTTSEAAGHTGGFSGKGGDLLYRWGNPRAYGAGTANDQALFAQHDAEWIEAGIPGQGNILIFNNGGGRPYGNYSSIEEITPPVTVDGSYTLSQGLAYGPDAPVWRYTAAVPSDFFAENISGQQRLPNGNTLICDGPSGHFFEVTASGETVWEYQSTEQVFRVERYAPDYSGFQGTELYDGSSPPDPVDTETTSVPYPIVDTGQVTFYDTAMAIGEPAEGTAFYGQDAQFSTHPPSYRLSQDGLTVYDAVTGLTWTKSPDLDGDGDIDVNDKLSFADALTYADSKLNPSNFGGYGDWRLPSMKELYSLMNFSGTDPIGNSAGGAIPFIDTSYFDFGYGDTASGERVIDSQFWSSNAYLGYVFGNQSAAFGLNLADGRIKGYPSGTSGPITKVNYVYFVRGNSEYGINAFQDNGDATVTDKATGLMWSQNDSGFGMTWEEALAWARTRNNENYLGHDDWRLPNAKEMQSLLDYSRAPDATGSAAIDPVFAITEITNEAGQADYPWFWTGTTHVRADGNGSSGVYVCFGRAMGYMNGSWLDVHGAGAQRSDRKTADFSSYTYVPDGYYFAMSPQGDAARIYNYVRLVRDADL